MLPLASLIVFGSLAGAVTWRTILGTAVPTILAGSPRQSVAAANAAQDLQHPPALPIS
jgi:hypothetical protein